MDQSYAESWYYHNQAVAEQEDEMINEAIEQEKQAYIKQQMSELRSLLTTQAQIDSLELFSFDVFLQRDIQDQFTNYYGKWCMDENRFNDINYSKLFKKSFQ